jgi:Ca2+-binding EF-hand superfamily protein
MSSKELTDEEIEKIAKENNFYWNEYGGFVSSESLVKVIRDCIKESKNNE